MKILLILILGFILFGCSSQAVEHGGSPVGPMGSAPALVAAENCSFFYKNTEIKSLQTKSVIQGSFHEEGSGSVSGSFFLGIGSISGYSKIKGDGNIETNTVYYFYSVTEDGGYKLDSSLSSNTIIYENSSAKPHMTVAIINDTRPSTTESHGTANNIPLIQNGYCLDTTSHVVKLIVSNGTIIQDYSAEVN